jgi:hypothetical protein
MNKKIDWEKRALKAEKKLIELKKKKKNLELSNFSKLNLDEFKKFLDPANDAGLASIKTETGAPRYLPSRKDGSSILKINYLVHDLLSAKILMNPKLDTEEKQRARMSMDKQQIIKFLTKYDSAGSPLIDN